MSSQSEVKKYLKLKQDLEILEEKLKEQKKIVALMNGAQVVLDGVPHLIKVSTTTRYTPDDSSVAKAIALNLNVLKNAIDMDKLKKVVSVSNDLGYVPVEYLAIPTEKLKKVINLSDFCKSSSYDVIKIDKIDA